MSGLGWLYSMVESSVLTTAESNQIDEKTFEDIGVYINTVYGMVADSLFT